MLTTIEAILTGQPELSEDEQRQLFTICAASLPLTRSVLTGDLQRIPTLLRLALLSSVLYVGGIVLVPDELADELEAMVESHGTYWPEAFSHSGEYSPLGSAVLQNPTLDLAILLDEFESPGDSRNLEAMLRNPALPNECRERLIAGEHSIFEDLADGLLTQSRVDELVDLAKSTLGDLS